MGGGFGDAGLTGLHFLYLRMLFLPADIPYGQSEWRSIDL
jgi:hypothetical protein